MVCICLSEKRSGGGGRGGKRRGASETTHRRQKKTIKTKNQKDTTTDNTGVRKRNNNNNTGIRKRNNNNTGIRKRNDNNTDIRKIIKCRYARSLRIDIRQHVKQVDTGGEYGITTFRFQAFVDRKLRPLLDRTRRDSLRRHPYTCRK